MTFEARLDDPESKAFWESIARSAHRADALPDWQKGILGEPARIVMREAFGDETPGGPPGERHERGGGSQ